MGSGAWAAHDYCGHPSESRRAADSDSGTSPSDSDCACVCCQADTVISFPHPILFQFDPLWTIETTEEFGSSRAETDIFRPPLA
ncbi:MAG: hypothetical protein M0Z38_00150 [Deltaproteobacteria bacterium]|nr:hypothetical protein [Deltaproteobacteria bacterium]